MPTIDPSKVRLQVGGREMGTITLDRAGRAQLSEEMLEKLRRAVLGKEDIIFSGGKLRWQLANHGANLVLHRMDIFQGRDGTATALVERGESKGDMAERQPVPTINYRPLPTQPPQRRLPRLLQRLHVLQQHRKKRRKCAQTADMK